MTDRADRFIQKFKLLPPDGSLATLKPAVRRSDFSPGCKVESRKIRRGRLLDGFLLVGRARPAADRQSPWRFRFGWRTNGQIAIVESGATMRVGVRESSKLRIYPHFVRHVARCRPQIAPRLNPVDLEKITANSASYTASTEGD